VETLRVGRIYGLPKVIRFDQRTEFVSRELDLWAYTRGVTLDFSQPKPTDNAFIESFNGKLRGEYLNAHWFMNLEDAREKCEAWRRLQRGSLSALECTLRGKGSSSVAHIFSSPKCGEDRLANRWWGPRFRLDHRSDIGGLGAADKAFRAMRVQRRMLPVNQAKRVV
jgi:hypothetical protein